MIIARTSNNLLKHCFIIVSALFVLCLSCPVKAGIKKLVGISSDQNISSKKNTPHVNTQSETCTKASETPLAITGGSALFNADFTPVIIFTATAVSFLILAFSKEKIHPRYNNSQKIAYTVPIFLRHRKLTI